MAFPVLHPSSMFGIFRALLIPCEKCTVSSCKRCINLRWAPRLLPKRKAMDRWPFVWGAGTGEKSTSCYPEVFRSHLTQRHPQTMVYERCAKSVEDLTKRIARAYAYPVAYGGFSDVWSCLLRHMQSPAEKVAVKAIRSVIANAEEYQVKKKAVKQELSVWAGLRHPNVLPLYGIAHEFGPFPAFVCPWADNGTLSQYLEKSGTRLDLKNRMTLVSDIAAGLQYLHSKNIIHGDLSGSNVLITNDGGAWLSDFGLSTLVEQVSDTVLSGSCFPGNIRWAAPELICREDTRTSQLSSQEVDIYSFGSIMLQVLSGKVPFHDVCRDAQVVIMISRGHKPSREPGWDGRDIPNVLWDFMEACWASPSKRPSSTDIVNFITNQLSKL